ncbi:MAG: type II toxin-antitoxin system VapC family toxin [Bryobacteraceae bacterium]
MNGGLLLDTNVPSELMRPRPEPKVQSWVAAQDIGTLFVSVVSIGELETGFVTTPDAARRARLEASLVRFLALLVEGRILPVTQAIAVRWGRLDGMRRMAGRPLSAPDGMIAATALEHGLTLVTRNVKDFAGLGVAMINPWLD